MTSFIIIVHVFVCIALVLIVLLQVGKGASLGAAFGGASQTMFGGRGAASFLQKLTTGAAVVFMITSLALSLFVRPRKPSSVMEGVKAKEGVQDVIDTGAEETDVLEESAEEVDNGVVPQDTKTAPLEPSNNQ